MNLIMQQYYGDKVVMEPILPRDEEWPNSPKENDPQS